MNVNEPSRQPNVSATGTGIILERSPDHRDSDKTVPT